MHENIKAFLKQVRLVDTEASNVDVYNNEIIELAVGTYGNDWTFTSRLFNAEKEISIETQELTHLTHKKLAAYPFFSNALEDVVLDLDFDNVGYYVAHKAEFDRISLESGFARNGVDISEFWKDKWIDTLKFSRILYQNTGISYRLGYLRYWLGLEIDTTDTHRASSDLMVLAGLLEKLIDDAIDKNLLDPNEDIGKQLITLMEKPIIYHTFPFGKHKGKFFADIPTDYYAWALNNLDSLDENNANFDSDLSASVLLELNRRLGE